jgi:hypothetical protein
MMRILRLVPFVLLTALLPAQQDATTLLALGVRADAVAVATATSVTEPAAGWLRVTFRTDERLRGELPPAVSLLEPAGRCCGLALHALAAGDGVLLFLSRSGPNWHVTGGARGVLEATPGAVAHVRALLAAAPADRAGLLIDAFDHVDQRVADDAVLALPGATAGALTDHQRARFEQRLRTALELPNAQLPALLAAAPQVLAQHLDVVLPHYLTAPDHGQLDLLRRHCLRLDDQQVLNGLLARWPEQADAAGRAVQLLCGLPALTGRRELLAASNGTAGRTARLLAVQTLLEQGVPEPTLRASVPGAVVDLALQRLNKAPARRAIRPEGHR